MCSCRCYKVISPRPINYITTCETPIRICTKFTWYQDYNELPCPQYHHDNTYKRTYAVDY